MRSRGWPAEIETMQGRMYVLCKPVTMKKSDIKAKQNDKTSHTQIQSDDKSNTEVNASTDMQHVNVQSK